ncbi:hypothetical protein SDC9_211070 [bioreactor metagenome]|uniref:Uncharacterized protein n=1 Tax=bioreactor metagenome TaxID=1076179 RepID=A0A645JJA8_9ZZZZ
MFVLIQHFHAHKPFFGDFKPDLMASADCYLAVINDAVVVVNHHAMPGFDTHGFNIDAHTLFPRYALPDKRVAAGQIHHGFMRSLSDYAVTAPQRREDIPGGF